MCDRRETAANKRRSLEKEVVGREWPCQCLAWTDLRQRTLNECAGVAEKKYHPSCFHGGFWRLVKKLKKIKSLISLPHGWMEKGEETSARSSESSLPLLLWKRLSFEDHYDAATLPRKLFNWCSGQSAPQRQAMRGDDGKGGCGTLLLFFGLLFLS